MKALEKLDELKAALKSNENVWLLLYKQGSVQSECSVDNIQKALKETGNKHVLYIADVSQVNDIHPQYGITTVPSLLYFEKEQLRNVVKGCHSSEQYTAILDKSSAILTEKGNHVQKNVTVYTTPTCSWCNTIKRHLTEHGIRYREVDVSRDQKAAEEMVRRSGQQGVPQTDINGQMIVGFDKTKINSLLEIN